MKKRFSIQRYLTAYMLSWIIAISLLAGYWVYSSAKHEVTELFDASLVQTARTFTGLFEQYSLAANTKDPIIIQPEMITAPNKAEAHEYEKSVAFQVWDSDKKLVFKSQGSPDQPLIAFDLLDALKNKQSGFHNTQVDAQNWRTFSLYSAKKQWWVMVAEEDDIREELAEYIVHGHVLPIVLGIPLLLLLLRFLIQKGMSPLQRFAGQLKARHYRDLTRLNDNGAPEETLELVNSINHLFSRLNESYQRESRFTADVAHELRNPLASLMIHTENALEDTVEFSQQAPQAQSQSMQQHNEQQVKDLQLLKDSILRLSHSVQQLLSLSKAESQKNQESMENIHMSSLIDEVSIQYQHQLTSKQMQLELNTDNDCHFNGYPSLLFMLVSNLLSNAINYSPHKSQIQISCRCTAETMFLTVDDSGVGIPQKELSRVKERFYRNPSNKAKGAGLGLSIVDAIVKQHQGEWGLEKSKLGGLKVKVTLHVN